MQLPVVVLLARVSVVAALAGCHGDRDKDHRPRQNCTAGGFSRVPAGLDPSTEVLLFPHNLFSGLAWSSFQPFAQLYEVDLTANQVPQVPAGGPPLLPTLSVLRLGSNLVSALPDGSFSACPALTELYLDNNAIGSLANHTFSGLALLKLLDLSSNRIQVLPPVLLHPLASLDTLILENNQVQAVPDDWFGQKEEVPYLLLAANPWVCGCALRYLKAYLAEYGDNVYVRAGPTYTNNPDSVVCHSPPRFNKRPVDSLDPSELCPRTSPAPVGPGTRTPRTQPTSPAPDRRETRTPWTWTQPTSLAPVLPGTRTPWTWTQPTSLAPVLPGTRTPWTWTQPTSPAPDRRETRTPWTWTQPTSPAPDRRETRTSVPVAGPTTDRNTRTPWTWAQSTSQSTLAPPLATDSTTPTKPTTDPLPSSQTATPVVIATGAGGATAAGLRGSAHFCVYLFAGCLLLCLLSAAVVLATSGRLLLLYWTSYRPLKASLRRGAGPAGLRLLSSQSREEAGPRGGVPVYRSVLFVRRDEEEEEQEEVGFYRTTVRRLLSREEELQGWRDVTEECGGARPGRRGYSVILRQEAERGAEPLEWVLGAWEETTRGGARARLDPGLLS